MATEAGMEKTAAARIGVLVEALGLAWTTDDQPAKVEPVVLALAERARARAELVRLLQLLCLDPSIPEARRRPCFGVVQGAIREKAPTLAQGETGLRWAQVVALAAVERVEDRGEVASAATFLRIGLERGGERNSLAVDADALVAVVQAAAGPDAPAPAWSALPTPSVQKKLHDVFMKKHLVVPEKVGMTPAPNWTHPETLAVLRESLYPALNAIYARLSSDSTHYEKCITGLDAIVQELDRRVVALSSSSTTTTQRELQALWWGQSLYSRSRRASYRDLSGPDRLYTMAEDLLDVWGPDPDESLVAWYVETVLRVDPQAAELTWPALARGLPERAFGNVPEPLRSDPTAAPISALLGGSRPGSDEEAERAWSSSGLPELSGRALLRQLLRERQLARWLAQSLA